MRLVFLTFLMGLAASMAACSGKLLSFGEGEQARFRHRELGYTIAYPSVVGQPGWEIESLDESDLLVRHEDGSAWALASTCRLTSARIELLAAELARATGGHRSQPGRAVRQAGLDGWSQQLQRVEETQTLEIKTITLRGARCTYDWIFVAPDAERLTDLEPLFDEWWKSFEPGPGALGAADEGAGDGSELRDASQPESEYAQGVDGGRMGAGAEGER